MFHGPDYGGVEIQNCMIDLIVCVTVIVYVNTCVCVCVCVCVECKPCYDTIPQQHCVLEMPAFK